MSSSIRTQAVALAVPCCAIRHARAIVCHAHDWVVIVSFARRFWRSARRPAVFRRCSLISLVVGTLLTVVNQFDALASGITAKTALGMAANYLIPFIVSNLGAMSAQSET
jgi:hypothetical protein